MKLLESSPLYFIFQVKKSIAAPKYMDTIKPEEQKAVNEAKNGLSL